MKNKKTKNLKIGEKKVAWNRLLYMLLHTYLGKKWLISASIYLLLTGKYNILMAIFQVIPNIYWVYKHILRNLIFDHLILRNCASRESLNQLLKIEGNNTFKDLLTKKQFPRAVLSKDFWILGSLNKEPVWEFLVWKNIILRTFSVIREGF